MPDHSPILSALQDFAEAVTRKTNALTAGEPEAQLRAPFETFMNALEDVRHVPVQCKDESKVGRIGKPDFAILSNNLLVGHVELKAPGTGADPKRFKGHNRKQWDQFKAFPNLLYCDGNEWGLYRNGERVRRIARLSGEVDTDGKKAVVPDDVEALWGVLADFLHWDPIPPKNVTELIKTLAPLCRSLRENVIEALHDPNSPLHRVAEDWRELLFPDASDRRFADAYAQTVTFALLLARGEGADPLTLASAGGALMAEHGLLSRALQVLTDPNAREEISASVDLLVRMIDVAPHEMLKAEGNKDDPWLFFYEDFLAEYDPKLRKDAGAYYTPVEVAAAQVRLIDDLLTNRLEKPLGFADPHVITLDPAAGTGTYLISVIDHALDRVAGEHGAGAVPGKASALAKNMFGFEIMVGPYAVAELRVHSALARRGAEFPDKDERQDLDKDPNRAWGLGIYLTDTLESPHAEPPQRGLMYKQLAEQHERALKLKNKTPVIVCLGNPPYDRHPAADPNDAESRARTGHWVRWGDDGEGGTYQEVPDVKGEEGGKIIVDDTAILNDFTQPAKNAGHGGHLKNLYNLYVYFWRWALWKVFESGGGTGFQPVSHGQDARATSPPGPGVVSFISASSYLDGDAFCGMREHMRRVCDEVWILDLGGEGRGTRQTDNVFNIQTPVAIAVAFRRGEADKDTAANVHYARISGTEQEKLKALEGIHERASLTWENCPDDWHAPFRPAGTGIYQTWPMLTTLFPWQHSGAQAKRTWPIAPSRDILRVRWRNLLAADSRADALKETRDRKVGGSYLPLTGGERKKPIAKLSNDAPAPPIRRYAYRSFDRQWLLADSRLGDYLRPVLWAAHSGEQVYMASLLTMALGSGPAATASTYVPDLHCFAGPGKGAKDIVPLYRDAAADEPNILPGLPDLLGKKWHGHLARDSRAGSPCHITPEDFLAYVYGVLAQPAFTERFADELGTRELRVPLTKDAALFAQVRDIGAKLLWLHTYGERYVPEGEHSGHVPQGKAGCTVPVPQDEAGYPEDYEYNEATKTLHVGAGEFAPVAPEVYAFEVSGLKVVQSWLGYRMKNPKGKKSSPLDDINPTRWPSQFNDELLELLWVLEHTLAEYPRQAELLDQVLDGPLFAADELPEVPDRMRKPPKRKERGQKELYENPDEDGDE